MNHGLVLFVSLFTLRCETGVYCSNQAYCKTIVFTLCYFLNDLMLTESLSQSNLNYVFKFSAQHIAFV